MYILSDSDRQKGGRHASERASEVYRMFSTSGGVRNQEWDISCVAAYYFACGLIPKLAAGRQKGD
jgi:hypothetical protein